MKDFMPIRIRRCRDKSRDRAQPTEDKGVSVLLVIAPMAYYAGKKPKLHMLCGSIGDLKPAVFKQIIEGVVRILQANP